MGTNKGQNNENSKMVWLTWLHSPKPLEQI